MKLCENVVFIGIDTSNYTTSAAVCDVNGNILANLKIPLTVADGERGLRQSAAVFAHVKNLPVISEQLREYTKGKIISAVGCSAYPRNAENSYMPCFLAGKSAASLLAASLNIPLYLFSHQNGHIMAALHSSDSLDFIMPKSEVNFFAAFHVSGGTTEIVIAHPDVTSENIFEINLAGETKDLNAGQAIDRAGVMMGLKFPCGAEMEKLALLNEKELPEIKTSVNGLECNLSGLENKAKEVYSDTGDKNLTSAYVLESVARTLEKMTDSLMEIYGKEIPLIYAGGVMSCSIIKDRLSRKFSCRFAKPEFSSDNASGIALMARYRYINRYRGNDK